MTLRLILLASVCSVLVVPACSKSNNLLLGRVEAQIGGHTVVVTDCYRTSVPQPQIVVDIAGGPPTHRFVPCRDAQITIRGDELTVNGASYGKLASTDTVVVDHGKVLINDREAHVVAASH